MELTQMSDQELEKAYFTLRFKIGRHLKLRKDQPRDSLEQEMFEIMRESYRRIRDLPDQELLTLWEQEATALQTRNRRFGATSNRYQAIYRAFELRGLPIPQTESVAEMPQSQEPSNNP